MSKSSGVLARLLVSALFLAGAVAQPATAQDKKADKKGPIRAQKVLADNDRVRVTQGVFKPGEMNPMEKRGYRVTRVLKGSTTMERTHADGKVEKVEFKEGGVIVNPGDNASLKNVGKSEVTIYTVTLKK